MTITKDTIIGDILDADRNTAPYFLDMGMHCLGCPASRGESVARPAPCTAWTPTSSWRSSMRILANKWLFARASP